MWQNIARLRDFSPPLQFRLVFERLGLWGSIKLTLPGSILYCPILSAGYNVPKEKRTAIESDPRASLRGQDNASEGRGGKKVVNGREGPFTTETRTRTAAWLFAADPEEG